VDPLYLEGPGPKIRPQPGRRQRPAARQRRRALGNGGGDLTGCGQEFAGVGVDGLDGDLVAEAFEAADVVAGAAADVLASFVVVGAEVGVDGVGIGEQGVADDQLGPVGLDYSIAPGQACGLRSSLGDLLGGLPACALPARRPDGAGPA
jgi:hypothetical protein